MKQVYLGAMGWSYGFWPIYENTASQEYLTRYSENFNSVEVNSTFYRIPRKTSVENWRTQTPDDFLFSVKIPQSISHSSGLNYDPEKLDAFLVHIKLFQDKLGPLLLQLPPRLTPDYSDQLDTLLTHLQETRLAVEFRHKDWFTEETYQMLRDHNAALVYVEHPWQPTAEIDTSDFAYVRLEGERRQVDGGKGVTELDRTQENEHWANRIHTSEKTTYLYVSKFYSGYPPTDIRQIKDKLDALKKN